MIIRAPLPEILAPETIAAIKAHMRHTEHLRRAREANKAQWHQTIDFSDLEIRALAGMPENTFAVVPKQEPGESYVDWVKKIRAWRVARPTNSLTGEALRPTPPTFVHGGHVPPRRAADLPLGKCHHPECRGPHAHVACSSSSYMGLGCPCEGRRNQPACHDPMWRAGEEPAELAARRRDREAAHALERVAINTWTDGVMRHAAPGKKVAQKKTR